MLPLVDDIVARPRHQCYEQCSSELHVAGAGATSRATRSYIRPMLVLPATRLGATYGGCLYCERHALEIHTVGVGDTSVTAIFSSDGRVSRR